MEFKNLFDKFDFDGKLLLPAKVHQFGNIPWSPHSTFEGVELKHIITSQDSNGVFSYHLVRIAPGKMIRNHVHKEQLETHEVIAGNGFCINNGAKLIYETGVISIFNMDTPHEILAGEEGLYLFAKFIPALN